MTTLILLPGLDGSAVLFEPLCAQLDAGIAVRRIAYPAKTFLAYAALTDFVRDNLPEGPLLLLGESFSGPVAVMVAAAERERVKGVILSTSFIRSPSRLLRHLGPLLSLMPLGLMPPWLLHGVLFGRHATPRLVALLQRALAGVPATVLKRRLQEVGRIDVSAALRELRCPLRYLQASQDRLIPDAAGATLVRAVPDATLCRLEGPHCLLQAAAEPAARQIEVFWRQVSEP